METDNQRIIRVLMEQNAALTRENARLNDEARVRTHDLVAERLSAGGWEASARKANAAAVKAMQELDAARKVVEAFLDAKSGQGWVAGNLSLAERMARAWLAALAASPAAGGEEEPFAIKYTWWQQQGDHPAVKRLTATNAPHHASAPWRCSPSHCGMIERDGGVQIVQPQDLIIESVLGTYAMSKSEVFKWADEYKREPKASTPAAGGEA